MIKKLLYTLLLFVGIHAHAQNQPIGSPNKTIEVMGGLQVDKIFRLLPQADTLTNSGAGSMVFAYGQAWLYTGMQWAGMTGIAWGKIPGNIAAQTDLIDSLNGKQSLLNNGYGWKIVGGRGVFDSSLVRKVDTVYRLNDSTIAYAINGVVRTLLVRGTAAGASVLSITLNTPAGIFVSIVNYTSDGAGHWTGTLALNTQTANSFLVGPVSGGPGTPGFRQMVTGDLPINIPNGNLQNSTIGLSIGGSGTSPAFSTASVALGGTIILNLPIGGPGITGIISASDWNRFNNATIAQVTSVNGQTGATVVMNADSLGSYPIDFTNYRNGYVLALDTVNGKLVFNSPAAGTGIASLNSQTGSSQSFASGTSGTSPNISSAGNVHTFNTPIVNGADTGTVTPGLYNTWNSKQAALSGTGYLKLAGTTPSYLTPAQATADLILFTTSLQGLVPASGGGTSNFLRADGTWAAPPGGGGSDSGIVAGIDIIVNRLAANNRVVNADTTAGSTKLLTQGQLGRDTANIKLRLDTLGKPNAIYIRGHGQPGDTTIITAHDSVLSPAAIRDSSATGQYVRHTVNPDGSWTFYNLPISGGSGSTNITITRAVGYMVINSSSGTGDTIRIADSLHAGLMDTTMYWLIHTPPLKVVNAGGTGDTLARSFVTPSINLLTMKRVELTSVDASVTISKSASDTNKVSYDLHVAGGGSAQPLDSVLKAGNHTKRDIVFDTILNVVGTGKTYTPITMGYRTSDTTSTIGYFPFIFKPYDPQRGNFVFAWGSAQNTGAPSTGRDEALGWGYNIDNSAPSDAHAKWQIESNWTQAGHNQVETYFETQLKNLTVYRPLFITTDKNDSSGLFNTNATVYQFDDFKHNLSLESLDQTTGASFNFAPGARIQVSDNNVTPNYFYIQPQGNGPVYVASGQNTNVYHTFANPIEIDNTLNTTSGGNLSIKLFSGTPYGISEYTSGTLSGTTYPFYINPSSLLVDSRIYNSNSATNADNIFRIISNGRTSIYSLSDNSLTHSFTEEFNGNAGNLHTVFNYNGATELDFDNVNSKINIADSVVLNNVPNGSSADSVLTLGTNHTIHKIGALTGGAGLSYTWTTSLNSADFTVAASNAIKLVDLTGQANHNIVLPSLPTGNQVLMIVRNINSSSFTWTFTGATVKDAGNNSITTLSNNTTYQLSWDGSTYVIIN